MSYIPLHFLFYKIFFSFLSLTYFILLIFCSSFVVTHSSLHHLQNSTTQSYVYHKSQTLTCISTFIICFTLIRLQTHHLKKKKTLFEILFLAFINLALLLQPKLSLRIPWLWGHSCERMLYMTRSWWHQNCIPEPCLHKLRRREQFHP